MLAVSHIYSYGSIYTKNSVGFRGHSVVSWLRLMNISWNWPGVWWKYLYVCMYTGKKFTTPHLLCSLLAFPELLFQRENSYSTCIPKANLYNNQCVMQPHTHSQQSSLLPDRFFNGSHHIVWWSLALLKGRSRNLWLHRQPSMVLPAPASIPPPCQLTPVLASSNLTMPEPLWRTELAKDFAESSAKDLPSLGRGVLPTSLGHVSLEQILPRAGHCLTILPPLLYGQLGWREQLWAGYGQIGPGGFWPHCEPRGKGEPPSENAGYLWYRQICCFALGLFFWNLHSLKNKPQ